MPTTYHYYRLGFKRDQIEPLADRDHFTVITPVGTFRMTKAAFYSTFPNVVESRSYRISGRYHYPKVPEKALRYLI